MNKENYPTWLVPLDIAQELKAIGFDIPCHFYYQNDYSEYLKAGDPDKYHIISDSLAANRKNANHNKSDIAISAPTWEQVFQWFREKDYYGNLEVTSKATSAYIFTPKDFGTSWAIAFKETYEEAREALVVTLIQTYKSKQL